MTGIKLVAISNEAAQELIRRLTVIDTHGGHGIHESDLAAFRQLIEAIKDAPDSSEAYGVFGALREVRPEMAELMERMATVQLRKAKEYAKPAETYSNYVAAGAAVGIPGWKYAEARLAEKQARHEQLMAKDLINEAEGGYRESAVDRANMALIACVMHGADI